MLHLFLSEGFNLQKKIHMSFCHLYKEQPEKKNLKLWGKLFYGHKHIEMVDKAFVTEMFAV